MFPKTVIYIGDKVLNGCRSLSSIAVEVGNSRYDSRENCNALIETATNTLLAGCENSIIPNGITKIADYAFDGCRQLNRINIPNTVVRIGKSAFSSCGIEFIKIANGITDIGDSAFYLCEKLESIEISSTVTNIGKHAFALCPYISWIKVDGENPVYDSRDNCDAIIETKTNTLILGCYSTLIPYGVKSIGNNAFHAEKLSSIIIPNTVISIGDKAFYGCSELSSIIIPNSVKTIGNNAFESCMSLRSIVLGESVEALGDQVFGGCWALKNVTFFNTPKAVGENIFFECESLNTISIPNGQTSQFETIPAFEWYVDYFVEE